MSDCCKVAAALTVFTNLYTLYWAYDFTVYFCVTDVDISLLVISDTLSVQNLVTLLHRLYTGNKQVKFPWHPEMLVKAILQNNYTKQMGKTDLVKKMNQ